MSKKLKGSESILYDAVTGTTVTTGALTDDTWYKIKAVATTGTALPTVSSASSQVGAIFKSPKNSGDAITLVSGDEVWPLTLSEICKVDVEISGEMGTIDATDSCDYPYMVNLPDGYTNLSGSINTMMRFDDDSEEIVSVTKTYLKKFYDIVNDDGEGTYTLTSKDDSDVLLMIRLNKNATSTGQVEVYLITPAVLTSISNNIALKDVDKADYSWSKGQGPASFYQRTVVAAAE